MSAGVEIRILAAAGLIVAMVLLLTHRHGRAALLFLIGAAAGFDTLQLGGVHLFSVGCFLLSIPSLERDSPRPRARPWIAATLVCACASLLATSVLYGALVNNPVIALQLLLLALNSAFLVLLMSRADALMVMYGLLAAITVGALVALMQVTSLIAPDYFADSSGILRVHSFYREPDFMAVFLAVGVVLAFRLPLPILLQRGLIALISVPLVLSYARGSWLALIASTLIVTIASRLSAHPTGAVIALRRTRLALATVAVLGLALLFNAHFRTTVVRRVAAVVDNQQGDLAISARSGQIAALNALADTAPWHGLGLSAGGRVTGLGEVEYGRSTNNVATTWVLDWWIGGKYLALPLILLVVVFAGLSLRSLPGHVLVLLLINSLVSNVMMSPVAWLALALVLIEISPIWRPKRSGVLVLEPVKGRLAPGKGAPAKWAAAIGSQ